MTARLKFYIGSIVGFAAISSAGLYVYRPQIPGGAWAALAVLAALGIAADMMSFALAQSTAGSISFIPYFAAAALVPFWPTAVVVGGIRLAFEVGNKRPPTKLAFNVAQQVLSISCAMWIYVGLGGESLLAVQGLGQFTVLTQVVGLPALIAFCVGLVLNNTIVNGAVALSTGRSLWTSLIQGSPILVLMNLITAPLIVFFAWVYAEFGWIAAATLWVPILGLRQFHKTNIELERTNEELLQLMVKSLEARDPYTSGHSRRVQHYSVIIARALGLSEREIEQTSQAALLHDVGKIHEKYAAVLSKTEKLTSDEWTLIQEHPIDGANLVATMSRLRDIVPAIRHHHENWDGTGYPDGLAGEVIPLAARIIRFADTIDAMTTQRPYRAPLTEPQVRAELIRCRGTQFDPALADRLLSSGQWKSLFVPGPSFDVLDAARLSLVGRSAVQRGPRSASKT